MPSKYDRLRDYLTSRQAGEGQVTLLFADIDRLVGDLPESARSRREWWGNATSSSSHGRAWLEAGWRVESVDLDGKSVTFRRHAKTPDPSPGNGRAEEGTSPPEKKESRHFTAVDAWALIIAAVSAAVTAKIALGSIPSVAVALLTAGVAALGFAGAQAIATHDDLAASRKWTVAAVAMAVVIGLGVGGYHEVLDPATHPGMPFTVQVSVDPPSQISPETCRSLLLPGTWHAPAPPSSLTQPSINSWEQSHQAIDGHRTLVTIGLFGASSQKVIISGLQIVVASRTAPLRGPVVNLGAGCGAVVPPREFSVNLDEEVPAAVFHEGTALPSIPVGGSSVPQAQGTPFSISDHDPEYFVIDAETLNHFVRWYLDIDWQSPGGSGTFHIGNTAPFQTSAYGPANPLYGLHDGTWTGPPN